MREGRKREVHHLWRLLKTGYFDFLHLCLFQFLNRMVANLAHSERDYCETLTILISIISISSMSEASRCEG